MDEGLSAEERPLFQRIADFPLVSLVIGVLIYALATALGLFLGNLVPPIGRFGTAAVHMIIIIALALAAYKLVIWRLGDRPHDDLRFTRFLPELGKGIVIGAVLFSAIVAIAALLGVYRIIGRGDSSGVLLALIASAILPGFMEELLFRGIIQRFLEELLGSWGGLALASLAFGFAHYFNPDATARACLWIALEAGVLLGGAYMLTRSLWLPTGLHAAWNFTQGAVFGVPISGSPATGLVRATLSGPELLSGGGFGLEASVIALVIATAAGIWFVWQAVRRGQLMQPWWVRCRAVKAGA
ncbi:MAG: CPBP family intramembrane glutamic endopeptidase [Sphingomicrobium sp.]